MKNRFTIPKVKSYPEDSNKDWYVWFRFNNGNPIRIKEGINKISDFNERLEEANALAEVLHDKLQKGWNPTAHRKKLLPQPYQNDLTILEAYKKALDFILKSNLEPKTKNEYKTHYTYFIESVKRLKWENHPFIEFETYHFTVIIDNMVKFRNHGNAYFNKHILITKAFCKYLKDNFIIKESKAHGIPERKHKAKIKNLLTSEQQSQIIKHFNNVLPDFNIYLKTLYHLSIRPKELRLLTCKMIKNIKRGDLEFLYFDLPEEITKNDKNSIILIPEDLKNDLLKFDLSNEGFYIFGKNFSPSLTMQPVNNANKLWKKEVKDGLGIQSDMYYLKSKSSNDKLRNGMPKEAVKIINRHSTEEITEIYATEHEIITMEQNMDKFGTFI